MDTLKEFARVGQAAAAETRRRRVDDMVLATAERIVTRNPNITQHALAGSIYRAVYLEYRVGRSSAYRSWKRVRKKMSFAGK